MNLLYISNEYPPDTGVGGIGTYTRQIAEGMALRGHGVQVICRSTSGRNETYAQDGIMLHRVVPQGYPLPQSKAFYPFRMLSYRLFPHSLVRLAWATTVYRAYCRLLRQGNSFNLIEYPECGAEGYYLSDRRSPTVARLHTPWEIVRRYDALAEPLADTLMQSHLERSSVRRATAVSSPSQALAHHLTKRWRLKDVSVYPNGLALPAFSRASADNWIYVGRIERRKGVHVLLCAYATACAYHTPPPLYLIGKAYGRLADGRLYGDFIQSLIDSLNLGERVRWIKGVPGELVHEHLANASAAFFPSLWENFPYACLEAMAWGLAIVASDCGGFPEMLQNNHSGLLVPPEDETALSAAMLRLLNEPGLGAQLGEAAREEVEANFEQSIVCSRAEEFYQSVICKVTP